jgi:hypothetical protein
MHVMGIKLPKVTVPKIKVPDIKVPDIKVPVVKLPDVTPPKVDVPKITTPSFPSQKDLNKIINTGKDLGKGIVNTGNQVVDTATKAAGDVTNAANDALKAINKTVLSPVNKAIVDSANEVANTYHYASDEVTAGATIVAGEMEAGAELVRDGACLIGEWVENNYCSIGMSVALGTFFAAMLYRPEPECQAQTTATMAPLSVSAIAYLAAKETVGDVVVGEACDLTAGAFVELLWLIPEVSRGVGQNNKEIFTAGISLCLAKSFEVAAGSFVVPQVGAAMCAGIITSITTQLVCEGKLPSGAREWAETASSGV